MTPEVDVTPVDAEAGTRLARARTVARLLDSSVRLPVVGYRVGLDPIVGLIPGVGDWLVSLLALYVVYQGYRVGVPKTALLGMLVRVGADALVGSVPILGDALDAAWKVNERNAERIAAHVESAASDS